MITETKMMMMTTTVMMMMTTVMMMITVIKMTLAMVIGLVLDSGSTAQIWLHRFLLRPPFKVCKPRCNNAADEDDDDLVNGDDDDKDDDDDDDDKDDNDDQWNVVWCVYLIGKTSWKQYGTKL